MSWALLLQAFRWFHTPSIGIVFASKIKLRRILGILMSDFKSHFRRQISFLETSCRLYDQGDVAEAIRLAVTLRVLLHDTKNSTSLLTHLQAKPLLLLSTAITFKKPQSLNLPLVCSRIAVPDFTFKAYPIFNTCERRDQVSFETWWRKERIIELNGKTLHRRELILIAANQDGGAHVDETIDPTYDLTRLGAGMEVEFVLKGGLPKKSALFENVHFASLRQIAYEILNSPAIQKIAK